MPEITKHGRVNMKEGGVVCKDCMINETLPNVYFLEKNGIYYNRKPVEWVNILITSKTYKNNE